MNIDKKLFDTFLKGKNFVGDDSTWPESWKTINHKEYRRPLASIASNTFPYPENIFKNLDILTLLSTRRSLLSMQPGVTQAEIIAILHHATSEKKEYISRPYASGGALYPVEIYYLNNYTGDDFHVGLYHYSPVSKEFSYIKKINIESIGETIGCSQEWVNTTSGVFILSYCPEKNMHKYGWFGVRAALIECGEISQNIQLLAEACDVRARMIGYGDQERIDELLEIDGYSELSLALIGIGKKA